MDAFLDLIPRMEDLLKEMREERASQAALIRVRRARDRWRRKAETAISDRHNLSKRVARLEREIEELKARNLALSVVDAPLTWMKEQVSTRARNVIFNTGVQTVPELLQVLDSGVKLRHCGTKTLREIQEFLHRVFGHPKPDKG